MAPRDPDDVDDVAPAVKRVRALVSGSVQAVGYRWACREEADRRGVAGSVRNLPDGRVEAIFEGLPEEVDAMVAWCGHGPRWAAVTAVHAAEEPPAGDSVFLILP